MVSGPGNLMVGETANILWEINLDPGTHSMREIIRNSSGAIIWNSFDPAVKGLDNKFGVRKTIKKIIQSSTKIIVNLTITNTKLEDFTEFLFVSTVISSISYKKIGDFNGSAILEPKGNVYNLNKHCFFFLQTF